MTFVVIISLMPSMGIPTFTFLDKIVHFIMYFVMAFLALIAFQLPRERIIVLLFTYGIGLMLEWLQGFLDHRTMSIEDFLANVLGTSAAIIFYFLLRKINTDRLIRSKD